MKIGYELVLVRVNSRIDSQSSSGVANIRKGFIPQNFRSSVVWVARNKILSIISNINSEIVEKFVCL